MIPESTFVSAINKIVIEKIDSFMQTYIIPSLDPSKVYWWVSLSGGKDSFTMAYAIFLWYKKNHYSFHGEGLYIKQWIETGIYDHLCHSIAWMPITVIHGEEETRRYTNYKAGSQAPCSMCSYVRKFLGDQYIIKNFKQGYYNVLSRGLHLTDMSISYLWRDFWGIDTVLFADSLEKGNPFVKLGPVDNYFLAKPLCFVREFECEQFAKFYNYFPVCCGCPACRFPSRRDIVEDSLCMLFQSQLWEFDVYGINAYLERICAPHSLRETSLPGKEKKCSRITPDFSDFAIKYWRSHEKRTKITFDKHQYLDYVGCNYLQKHEWCFSRNLFLPKYYAETELSAGEKMLIATVGPLWGAVAYFDSSFKNKVLSMQAEIFGIIIDELWTQVNPILQAYYQNRVIGFGCQDATQL